MIMRRLSILTPAFLACAFAITTYGQGTTSRVTGTVQDPNGATVPAATVTLTNEATNISANTETTSTGTYSFDAVQVGLYTITAEKQGFKKFISTGNKVDINLPATINVTLDVGGITEEVRVQSTV